jgi:signal transduction histidine kinase
MNGKSLARAYHLRMDWLRGQTTRVPPLLFDAGLALALGLIGAAQLANNTRPFEGDRFFRNGFGRGPFPGPGPNGGAIPGFDSGVHTIDYVLLGLCAACLTVRRLNPVLALIGVTVFAYFYLAEDAPFFSVQLIVLVAIYSAVADSSLPRVGAVALSLACAGVLAIGLDVSNTPRTDANWAMDAAWVMTAIFLGDSVRSRRAATAQAERSREEESRRRISDERLQIARELHDVVGHNISLINVQAGAGEHVLFKDPEQAQETFKNIRNASHETLQELRSLVGVLREPVGGEEQMAPTVGLDALDQLVKAISDAGQTVQLRVTGKKGNLAGIIDLSAYRILQEALTNTVRHAPNAKVDVAVSYGSDALSLEVRNDRGDGDTAPDPGGGHGLTGMRERVAAIGGRLDAGPEPDGGFRVRAVLPLARQAT